MAETDNQNGMSDQGMIFLRIALAVLLFCATACADNSSVDKKSLSLPWRDAGLSEREAAAHLLDRLAYGARPGEVDLLLQTGLEYWVQRQLQVGFADTGLSTRMPVFDYLEMSNREIYYKHPRHPQVKQDARRAGLLPENPDNLPYMEQKRILDTLYLKNGWYRRNDLLNDSRAHKLYRAVYSENQLQELLADFWFNHFSVSVQDGDTRIFIPAYERDAIRPYVLGRFRAMLGATARHPAMLSYLGNTRSFAPDTVQTLNDYLSDGIRRSNGRSEAEIREIRERTEQALRDNRRSDKKSKFRGINENYARELLELHTLGADGGYSQRDVIETARILTGWSTFPFYEAEKKLEARWQQVARRGFVREGDFLFRGDHHDSHAKTVLGRHFPARRGLEEGDELLDLLAAHPSTARHLSRKLAIRFVSDNPPEALVQKLSAVYLRSDGDLQQVMRTLVESPEFWDPQYRRVKIKSPFELIASALRATNATIVKDRPLLQAMTHMGQQLYGYQAPTGYPDRAGFWINTGALLNRMKFGLMLANGQLKAVRVDLPALNDYHEPESAEAALQVYSRILMPERDLSAALEIIRPILNEPEIGQKVTAAIRSKGAGQSLVSGMDDDEPAGEEEYATVAAPAAEVSLEQVVGILLGSPEFQRR